MSFGTCLKLIAPTQVRLLRNLEVSLSSFRAGDIVSLEKATADRLIAKGHAEAAPAGSTSVNRFTVAEAVRPVTSRAHTADAAPAKGDEAEARDSTKS